MRMVPLASLQEREHSREKEEGGTEGQSCESLTLTGGSRMFLSLFLSVLPIDRSFSSLYCLRFLSTLCCGTYNDRSHRVQKYESSDNIA